MGTPFRTFAPLALLAVMLGAIAAHRPSSRAEPVRSEKATVAGGTIAAHDKFVVPAEERVREMLDKPLPLEFNGTPLNEVCEQIGKKAGLKLELDDKGLKEAGIEADIAIHRVGTKDISLGSSLRVMLRPLHLCPVVTPEGAVLVTTQEAANAMLSVKLYHVQDLIAAKDDLGEENVDYETLIETLQSTVRPQSWDMVGGPGSIKGLQGALIVSQSQEVQQEIFSLLEALRKAKERQEKNLGGPALFAWGTPPEQAAYQRIRKKLEQPIALQTAEKKLGNVLDYLHDKQGLHCEFDDAALKETNLDAPLAAHVGGLPLRAQLQRLLRPLNMTYVIRDEVLYFTTTEAANATVETRVYPIGDLLVWSEPLDDSMVGGRTKRSSAMASNAPSDEAAQQEDRLLEALTAAVEPQSWDTVGGPGSVKTFFGSKALIVRHTQAMHDQVEDFLTQLRMMHREHPPLVPPAANAVAFEDKLLTRTFALPASTAGNYLPAADVAALVKKSLGAKVWEADGVLLRANEWSQSIGGGKDQPEQRFVCAALVVRHKPAVLRDVRRLLKELNLYQEPWTGGRPSVSSVPVVGAIPRQTGGQISGGAAF